MLGPSIEQFLSSKAPSKKGAKKVKEQEEQVKLAEKEVEAALEELRKKRLEVDKLKTHRVDWNKEMRKEQEIIDGREQDEMGTIIFSKHQRERM